MDSEKIRENKLRRMAERQGLRLEKCRRRDVNSIGYGTYHIIYAENGGGDWRSRTIIAGDADAGYGLTLGMVEKWLTTDAGILAERVRNIV